MNAKRVVRENLSKSPCQEACPAEINVPRYIRCIKEGKFDEALAVIREKIPFPSICGFACYSPCEANCGNRQFGEPIAIRSLKRTAAERGGELWKKNLEIAPDSDKKVAIIGSGPSGLTVAYYLAVLGHSVTVFEENDKRGGMLRMGIPEYRLPREALEKEIQYLDDLGVNFTVNQRVDDLKHLFKEGFDAVYLGCGAQQGILPSISGNDASGVIDGIAFLKKVNRGEKVHVGDRVAVIGGGNTAVDAARSSIRLGAKEVLVKYRRTRKEMTAYEEEVGNALIEGVRMDYLTVPVKIDPQANLLNVSFQRMQLGKPDASGRPSPEPIQGSEYREDYDTVIFAIGQQTDIPAVLGLPAETNGFIRVNSNTLETGQKGVFAGGDLAGGPASIIEAIADGRRAAASIDRYLGGNGMIDQELVPPEEEVVVLDCQAEDRSRVTVPCTPLSERVSGFCTVEGELTEDMACKEAERCRGCDTRVFKVDVSGDGCKDCNYCIEVCKLGVFEHSEHFNARGYRPVKAEHQERCVGCKACYYVCPDFSIEVEEVNIDDC